MNSENFKNSLKYMRKNSNYFGDVSQLFLKAKKEEEFDIDPSIKNEIRKSLNSKITEMKHPAAVQEQVKKAQISDFWNRWRYQLVGVPASLFALMMIVFAANNFHFTMQKEDFSPTTTRNNEPQTEIQASVLDTQTETTEPAVEKPKPELLVLNINDMGKNPATVETTNTTTSKTSSPSQVTAPATKTADKPAVTQPVQTGTQTQQPTTPTQAPTQTATQQQTTPQTGSPSLISNVITNVFPKVNEPSKNIESLEQDPIQPEIPASTPNTLTTIQDSLNLPIENLSATIPESANLQATPALNNSTATAVVTENTNIAQQALNNNIVSAAIYQQEVALKDQILNNNVLYRKLRTKKYPITYYGNSSLQQEPDFDKSIINELTNNKQPTAVNVYYLDENNVIIEVKEGETTKLYKYAKTGDTWTMVKYEKY